MGPSLKEACENWRDKAAPCDGGSDLSDEERKEARDRQYADLNRDDRDPDEDDLPW